MKREGAAVTKRYFFKVMMPGFHQKLRLPPAISKEIHKQKSRVATLQSRLGKWKVSLCSSDDDDDDLICFNKGWPEFVHRHSLTIGDFLYFEPTGSGDLHYHVYVFGSTACEKDFPSNDPIDVDVDEDEDVDVVEKNTTHHHPKDNKREGDGSPMSYFEKKMVPSSATKNIRINIPREFMSRNNLGLRESATLRDPSGKAWVMHLVRDTRDLQFRLRMTGQWRAFYASNGLNDGDICVFRLLHRLLTPTTLFFDIQIKRAA